MNFKKASVFMSCALLLGVLAGCGGNNNAAPVTTNTPVKEVDSSSNTPVVDEGKYQDGTYFAQGQVDENSGWQSFVVVNVEGGKITNAKWSATKEGVGTDKIAFSEAGKYGMKAGGAQAEWHEQSVKAVQYLIEKQDPKDITLNDEGKTDAISGVSVHVNEFFNLADEALNAGPIVAGPYKDGNYHAEEPAFNEKTGWKETADVVIAGGKIIAVNFSGVNENGDDKKQFSKDGNYGMVEKGGAQADWHEQALKAEQYMIQNQDVSSLTYTEEGATDAISGVSIKIREYYELATQALEQAK